MSIEIEIAMCKELDIAALKAKLPDVQILNGGDGTLVSKWREYKDQNILPIRNYGMCQKHIDMYNRIANGNGILELNKFSYQLIDIVGVNNFYATALSEIIIKNSDPTSGLRFNIYIDGKLANQNVIADGVILSTVLGSTGYFKSIARTIFNTGIGLAFINPTYSIPNIVLRKDTIVSVKLVRNADLTITCDKLVFNCKAERDERFILRNTNEFVNILGYDIFMCEECRRNRNSTIVNDSYMIS